MVEIDTDACAQKLRALADGTRLQILWCLFNREKCGTELAAELEIPQPQVAHHLTILKRAGLVHSARKGQRVNYSVHPSLYQQVVENGERTLDLGVCRVIFESNGVRSEIPA